MTELSPEPKKLLSNRQSYVEIPFPSNFVKFDLEKDRLKFSTIGLYGTNQESSFYKIMATVCGQEYIFSKPNWDAITSSIWRVE